eukprot:UN28377
MCFVQSNNFAASRGIYFEKYFYRGKSEEADVSFSNSSVRFFVFLILFY